MRYLLPLAFLAFLPSCSLLTKIMETGDRVGEGFQIVNDGLQKASDRFDAGMAKVDEKIGDVVATYTETKQAADTDGDGKTTASEWAAYLLATLTGGGGLLAEGRRRVGIRNAESDRLKAEREAAHQIRNAKSDGLKAELAARIGVLEAKAS